MTQRRWRKSIEVWEESGMGGRTFGCQVFSMGTRTASGCDSRDWRTMADDVFVSTCKSEKSLEVSSASLRNSVVSSVARLQKSSPTMTKKMSFGRNLGSENPGDLYRKWMFNSTVMEQRGI
jgi:hypothetical protein